MARSIHETWISFQQKERLRFSTHELKAKLVRESRRRLWLKRLIKLRVREERAYTEPEIAPCSALNVPIVCDDQSPLIHHGASVEDIRAVLSEMPPALTSGIQEIRLSLGKAEMDRCKKWGSDEGERDPYEGRFSHEWLAGVYTPLILGVFTRRYGIIFIFAFVWNKEAVSAMPHTVIEFILRIYSLSTLMHELAHHYDSANRIARGRWLFNRKATVEHYAENREFEWTREFVLPYLLREHATEWQLVKEWFLQHGGAEPTLELLFGDPRQTRRANGACFGVNYLWPWLMVINSVAKGEGRLESRLICASELLQARQYELCLQVASQILVEEPDHVEALSLAISCCRNSSKLEQAADYAERLLALKPEHAEAWVAKADLMQDQKEWEKLLNYASSRIEADKDASFAYRFKAAAFCALNRLMEMEELLRSQTTLVGIRNPEAVYSKWLRMAYESAGRPFPT